jgi:hypothetical protein
MVHEVMQIHSELEELETMLKGVPAPAAPAAPQPARFIDLLQLLI